ncbi:hypothetical protein SBA6_90028 [Candidatus Sulfopaludibacter sp. SbA6]|nr:hypothetical protein SBA6_90028 [Candidatus Sulfopaludibacter sp. SbA6]
MSDPGPGLWSTGPQPVAPRLTADPTGCGNLKIPAKNNLQSECFLVF